MTREVRLDPLSMLSTIVWRRARRSLNMGLGAAVLLISACSWTRISLCRDTRAAGREIRSQRIDGPL